MLPGCGFAEKVTLENLATYLPLLRAASTNGGGASGTRVPPPTLPGHFGGVPMRIPFPFRLRRPRSQRAIARRRRAARRGFTFTEAGFHYPQGTHLGHMLSVVKLLGEGERAGGPLDDRYIRMTGGLGQDRLGHYRRQVKYKLQASIEFGLVTDCRLSANRPYSPALTEEGKEFFETIFPILEFLDLSQPLGADGIPSSQMQPAHVYNSAIRAFIEDNPDARDVVTSILLNMPAVGQMKRFLRRQPPGRIRKAFIYANFFSQPDVIAFCNNVGIPPATQEGAKHRCPFLLNILDACGILDQTASHVILT
jgi:hypothetical protein